MWIDRSTTQTAGGLRAAGAARCAPESPRLARPAPRVRACGRRTSSLALAGARCPLHLRSSSLAVIAQSSLRRYTRVTSAGAPIIIERPGSSGRAAIGTTQTIPSTTIFAMKAPSPFTAGPHRTARDFFRSDSRLDPVQTAREARSL